MQLECIDQPVIASVDERQMQQLLEHVITNAVEAVSDASGMIQVRVAVREMCQADFARSYLTPEMVAGRYAVLTVSDTGEGMDSATLARMFEPFFTTRFVGRGLGLPAVLGIVHGHHGAVEVQSTQGVGSTIVIYLPLAEASTGVLAAQEPPSVVSTQRPTVLVVDDEAGMRSLLTRLLGRAGYEVLSADDGVTGLATLTAHPHEVKLVLLDVTMPQMGGHEALHLLRQQHPTLPVIMMSGYSVDEVAMFDSWATFSEFLHKPFQPADVLAAVEQALLRGSKAAA